MAAPAQTQLGRTVTVRIDTDKGGEIKAEPGYFEVSKGNYEQVIWACAQNHQHRREEKPCFLVNFETNGSPFYESQFSSDVPFSGLVRRDVLPGPKKYKYTVRVANNTANAEIDPWIANN